MANKRKALILFGGQSGEHEVSIVSATQVKQALDPARYDLALIGITKAGVWVHFPADRPLTTLDDPSQDFPIAQLPAGSTGQTDLDSAGGDRDGLRLTADVVLPILHGPHGEDGTVQGLLELTGLPYVGCGVLASAVAMDKVTAKILFAAAGIPVVAGEFVTSAELSGSGRVATLERLEQALSYPMFVKPSNLGSSVGVSKAADRLALERALDVAARYDRRILVETAVEAAREIEVAVLGNEAVRVSVPGEIIPDREFYDYDSKYADSSTSQAVIPADLSPTLIQLIQCLAERAYRAIDGAGMARVDFLLNGKTGELFINEINTIPGFTPISMYPKLWEASGVSYRELLDRLIELAIERATVKRSMQKSR